MNVIRSRLTPRFAVVLFGIAVIPLIYSAVLTWASQDPTHRLDRIPAAIVNDDRPARTADGGTVDLGARLVTELTGSTSDTNFSWVALDAREADARLASGAVLAVLEVPRDLSADAVSLGGADPAAATASRLRIRTNDGANQIVGTIAASLGTVITRTLSDDVSSEYLTSVYRGIDSVREQVAQAASGAADLATGSASAVRGASDLSTGLGSLSSGASTLSSGAQALADATATAAGSVAQLQSGAARVASGTDAVSSATTGLAAGLRSLASGYGAMTDAEREAALVTLAAQADGVAQGASGAAAGAAGLSQGTTRLLGDATAGTGVTTLQQKAAELAAGASSVADGAGAAAAGANELWSGLTQVDDGAQTLATGLRDGAAAIPSYSAADAAALSAVAADPIRLTASRDNAVPATGYALAPYFITLALWVGGLSFYLMNPALRERLLRGRQPSWLIGLRSALPGAAMAVVQSILVVLGVRFLVGIEPADLAGLSALVLLTSVTFVAINQALIALLGPPGRFLALVLIVFQLASAGATYPIQTTPDFLQAVHALLPFTYAVEGFRSLIAGGTIGLGPGLFVIGAWLLAALVGSSFAAWRARRAAGPGLAAALA